MNMLSSVTPWDKVAAGYAETAMKFFQGYVESALALVELNQDSHILDVACGPGTLALTAANRVGAIKAIDFSTQMIAILNSKIAAQGVGNIDTVCGDAQQLPYADNSFDAAFSLFGLMFFPDRDKGYAEIHRCLKPGGRVVISSWAPVTQSPLMQAAFGALRTINPAIPEPQTTSESLENPDFFKRKLDRAGFREIEIHLVTKSFTVLSIEQFWNDMVRGNAPLVMFKNSMSDEEWQEKNRIAIEYLYRTMGDKVTSLSSDAWLGTAVK